MHRTIADWARQRAQSSGVQGDPLDGVVVWIGASKINDHMVRLATLLTGVLKELGAAVASEPYLSEQATTHIMEHLQGEADLIIMIAATPGVSAEAMEISFATEPRKVLNKDKMRVYMPDEYRNGFIYRRLGERGAKIKPIPESSFQADQCSDVVKHAVDDAIGFALEKRRRAALAQTEWAPEIGIVTALPLELKAVLEILDAPTAPVRGKTRAHQEYYHGTIAAADGGTHRVVVALADKGTNSAAARTTILLEEYPSVTSVLMVGIAGGVPNPKDRTKHVWLGDVVVSDDTGVVQYDNVKEYTGRTDRLPPPRPPSAQWIHRVKNYVATRTATPKFWGYLEEVLRRTEAKRPSKGPLNDSPWFKGASKRVRQPRPINKGKPTLHLGPIGSANTVLKTAKMRDKLRDLFGVRAVEMEGSGIAEAAIIEGVGYFVIRGICDFANDGKNKAWQPYAAAAAAAFTKELIESMPTTP